MTQTIHQYESNGKAMFAVAKWNEKTGQYECPLTKETAKLTGCGMEFSRTLAGLGGFSTRKEAERYSRRVFGK